MKISSIKAIPWSPDQTPDSYGVLASRNFVAVKVETDEGITGWGDATVGPLSVANMVEELGDIILGEDPARIDYHWERLYHLNHVQGGPIQLSAISGIEMALWDIKGKSLGVPVYELLGGKFRDRIWTYGRWDGITPEAAVEHALSQKSKGLTALKGDPFDHKGLFISYEAEKKAVDTLAAVREAVGNDMELLVECHGRLAPSSAIRIANEMEQYRPFVYEEPVPWENLDALQRVAEAVNIPIATGERLYTKWDYAQLLNRNIVAMIQPDIIQGGGISEMKKIAAMAAAHYVGYQSHAIHGPMDVCSALHIAASIPNFMINEGGNYFRWREIAEDMVMGEFPNLTDGYVSIPTSPGLGVAMNEEWLEKHPPVETRSQPGNAIWAQQAGRLPSKQFEQWNP